MHVSVAMPHHAPAGCVSKPYLLQRHLMLWARSRKSAACNIAATMFMHPSSTAMTDSRTRSFVTSLSGSSCVSCETLRTGSASTARGEKSVR